MSQMGLALLSCYSISSILALLLNVFVYSPLLSLSSVQPLLSDMYVSDTYVCKGITTTLV